MAISLEKGQRVNVSLPKFTVGLGWDANSASGADHEPLVRLPRDGGVAVRAITRQAAIQFDFPCHREEPIRATWRSRWIFLDCFVTALLAMTGGWAEPITSTSLPAGATARFTPV